MVAGERDESIRSACFLALDLLREHFGSEIPYVGGLDQKFWYEGQQIPFFQRMKGIHRARIQRGKAALAVLTSYRSPYEDVETDDGFLYDYRAGSIDQPDNVALREACSLRTPIVYFRGTRPWYYHAEYPCFIEEDDPVGRRVLIGPGRILRSHEDLLARPIEDPIERRYAVRETKVRLHQASFRGRVLPAYREQCAVCRLKETRLLDAAHILGDSDPGGIASVSNGLSLCSIHHRAYDQNLVGISPGYKVHVAARLLADQDGPMLDLLKGSEGAEIFVPPSRTARPNRDLLEVRFNRFQEAA